MSDDNVKIQFDFEADPAAIGRIENALDEIAKKQKRVADEFEQGNVGLKEATNQNKRLAQTKNELLTLEKQLNAERLEAARIEEELVKLAEREKEAERFGGLQGKQERFDQVSKDVSLAGDFQSNLGALRGLSSAAGLGEISNILDVTGESVALIEELPRLLAATAGLPQTISASAAAIAALKGEALKALPALFTQMKVALIGAAKGTIAFLAGLGPIALVALAAAAAIAAIVAVLFFWRGSAEEAKKATEELIEAEKLTTEQAQERLKEIEAEKDKIAQLIEVRKSEGLMYDDLKERSKDLEAEQQGLTHAMESGATAINDVAEAEARLAEERSEAASEAGDDAKRRAELQQKIREANTAELNQIVENLNKKKEVLQAERDALAASGDQSEETKERIKKLDDQLQDLDEDLQQATSSSAKASAAEKDLAASREQAAKEEKAAKEKAAKEEKEARAKDQQERIQALKDATDKARQDAKKRTETQQKANEDLLKLQEKFNDDNKKAFEKAVREEQKATREAERDKRNILRDAGRQEKDLIASGDVFAIEDLREQATEDLSDLRDDFNFDANERKIQRNLEAQDRLREAREQRQKIRQTALGQLNDLGQANRVIRQGWQSMLGGLGKDLQTFTGAVSSNFGSVAGRTVNGQRAATNTVNVSIDGAPIRAIAQDEIRAVS